MKLIWKLLGVFCIYLVMSGCTTIPYETQYVEGTDIMLGIMLPYNGQIFGIQAFHYLSGRKYQSNTNVAFKTSQCVTNSAFGVNTVHRSRTEINNERSCGKTNE